MKFNSGKNFNMSCPSSRASITFCELRVTLSSPGPFIERKIYIIYKMHANKNHSESIIFTGQLTCFFSA